MINLARDWICALLPHVLSKINRVSYGLLTAKDVGLLEANGGARVPSSRRLLAVPFVGKDIPSRTNEFSHPDIVIGLTICAHRHEGLRRSDFKTVLRGLLNNLENETGPQVGICISQSPHSASLIGPIADYHDCLLIHITRD